MVFRILTQRRKGAKGENEGGGRGRDGPARFNPQSAICNSQSVPPLVLAELVLDAVNEGGPAGFDDVFVDADGAPGLVVVAAFDDDADAGGGGGLAVDDADLVIDQVHVG